jgi:hypothetical protein
VLHAENRAEPIAQAPFFAPRSLFGTSDSRIY